MGSESKVWLYLLSALVLSSGVMLHAQQPNDLIIINAKIVTVDNASFTPELGTVAQAMHVRDGKILHIGTTAQIRAMASPNSKVIDLHGRTVIPGIIQTHVHPYDESPTTPQIIKKVLTDDIVVTRVLGDSPEENLKKFPGVLAEAVSKAKPGEWIYILVTFGKNYEYSMGGNGGFGRMGLDPKVFNILDGKRITKQQLDAAAPNNPVLLRDLFTDIVLNQKGIDETVQVYSEPRINPYAPAVPGVTAGTQPMRWVFQDVMLRDHHKELVQIMRLGQEWWTGYGMTAFASNVYAPSNIKVFRELDRKGLMALREMWTWNWNPGYMFADPMFLNDIGSRTGEGTDYFWFGGGRISSGGGCTTAQIQPKSVLAKLRVDQEANGELSFGAGGNVCSYSPGSPTANLVYKYVKAGGRFINGHTSGDRDIDNLMNIIIKASKDAGMSDEEIQAKRHGFDHGVMWPRPDQIPILKRYNFIASGDAFEIFESSPAIFDLYGERGADWVVPKKRLVENQIYNTFEVDRSLGSTDLTIFSNIAWMINRKGWDGKAYATDQAVDRQTALKIATTWGAYYLLREKALGSLEPGKFADFAVLDRDYLTIPENDIPNIRVLMTVVGGKIEHLVPSLAREIGMQPTGAQVKLGGAPAGW